MIKKIYSIFCGIMICAFAAKAQEKLSGPYKVNIDVTKLTDQPKKLYIIFTEYVNGKSVRFIDSTVVTDGKAQFNGILTEPVEAIMTRISPKSKVRPKQGDYFNFYVSPEILQLSARDSLTNYIQHGGVFQKDYEDYKKLENGFGEKINVIVKKIRALDRKKDSVQFFTAFKEYGDTMNVWTKKVSKAFTISHSTSPVALISLKNYIGYLIEDPEGADVLLNTLSLKLKALPSAQAQAALIATAKRTKTGNFAPLFSQADTAGKIISLKSFRGKYVLLDFWASWCGPCRAENPNLIANFNKYKENNFTVLSVSLDDVKDKMAWLKAIHDDGITTWIHVSDLKRFDNEAAKLYGVMAIPQNFLINPEGKIIASNLRGKELNTKLLEIFGKN